MTSIECGSSAVPARVSRGPRLARLPAWVSPSLILISLALFGTSCERSAEGPANVVEAAIERHGGELFESSRIRFTFRGVGFEVIRDWGEFRYARTYVDGEGRAVVERMDNAGTSMEVDGIQVPLDDVERARVELDVNSVVYFGFLPFRLMDSAVVLGDLGPDEVSGEPYHVIEVTFREEGGGESWADRFVHWIHRDDYTLDFLAHEYHRDGGGIRFRRAVNRREIGGLVVQDYENFAPDTAVSELTDLPRMLEDGGLRLLSRVELEDVRVERVSP